MDEENNDKLQSSLVELVDVIKKKESSDIETAEKLDKLIEKMIENEEAAAEKVLLDAEVEELAKQEAEEAIDPDAVDLADLYKLVQEKIDADAEIYEYFKCPEKNVEEEVVVEEAVEGALEEENPVYLCEQLDQLIVTQQSMSFGTDTVVTYGIFYVPLLLIVIGLWFFFKPFLSNFR